MVRGQTEQYLPFLKRMLTPQRLRHSLGVMHVMSELAEVYSLDPTRAAVVGLLHDVAKDLKAKQQIELAEEMGIELSYPCERHPQYLHGPVSAYLVWKECGVTDELMLDAISTHTYYGDGVNLDLSLAWSLRFADLLAPSREWVGMRKLKTVVYRGEMEEAALLQSRWVIELFEEIGIPIHPNLVRVFRELSAKLGVDSSFFERW